MPFQSQAQRRKFYAMADRGDISDATVERWESETPKGKKLPQYVSKHASLIKEALSGAGKGFLIGGGLGALGGGLYGYKASDKKDRLTNTVANALGGGLIGGMVGRNIGAVSDVVNEARSWRGAGGGRQYDYDPFGGGDPFRSYRRGPESARARAPMGHISAPSWMGKVKTKAEAKAAFRREAMKHHPDLGGNPEKMKALNNEWEAFRGSVTFDKLAFLDELAKIVREARLHRR